MKKILIISSNRLGDCILSSGVIEYYRNHYKNSEITYVCGIVPSDLFESFDNIKNVIPLKKKKFSIHWLYLWFKVCLNSWDCIVDLRGTLISFFLLTKKRVCYSGINKNKKLHKVISTSQIIGDRILEPQIKISKKTLLIKENINFIRKVKKESNLIAMAPSANWEGKKWPQERFIQLIKKLINSDEFKNPKFLIFGSLNEIDDTNNISTNFSKDELINFSGSLKLNEIFLIFKYCDLFIGNDSGLMHLAAAAEIPTVGLFGPSDIIQYHPWGKNTLAIRTPESPDELMNTKYFSHKKKKSLMHGLELKTVERKVLDFYNKFNNEND